MKWYFLINADNTIIPQYRWTEDFIPNPSLTLGDINEPFYESNGLPLWKYENGQCVHRTAEEIQADIDAIPLPEPTETEQLRADMDFLTMENESLQTDVEQAKADIDYLLMLTEE